MYIFSERGHIWPKAIGARADKNKMIVREIGKVFKKRKSLMRLHEAREFHAGEYRKRENDSASARK